MDNLEKYRKIVQKTLTKYAKLPRGKFQSETVFDEKNDRYLLMVQGWDNVKRIHNCIAHLEIIDGKIWIQSDGTEDGIARELENNGVPKNHIVLAFHEPEVRKYTEYAIA